MRKFGMNNSFASLAKQSLLAIFLSIALAACGGDSGTSANDDNVSSSSSSVIPASSGNRLSSSSKKGDAGTESGMTSSSSSKVSSSSVIPASSGNLPSSSSKKDGGSSSAMTSSSSSSKEESSSSEYVPFDHSKTLAEDWRVGGEGKYKQFTDPRNGRSYYYIKIIGEDYLGKKDSVTIMAENLNIGKMVLGTEDQKDDKVIERYCYNNDTTKCDEFGGLYQWAEMMQLPSRCNTESCADLIEENHRGICPEGWRLMTDLDFYIAWHAETNSYGIKGTRSSYRFGGNNYSGLSLTGAGLRSSEGRFNKLEETTFWAYPEEELYEGIVYVKSSYVSGLTDHSPRREDIDLKTNGYSVRCVKVGD